MIINNTLTGYLKYLLLMTLSMTIWIMGHAQKRILIHGYVLDSISYSPITHAEVTNTNTNKSATTNEKGIFAISVGVNDMLFFSADKYHFDTLRYNMMLRDTIVVYLSELAHTLPGVTVTAKGYTKYQLDSMQRRQELLIAAGGPTKPAVSNANSGAGVGVNLDVFSKKEKNKKKAFKQFDENEKEAYVNFRFSPEVVTQYTGLTGDKLSKFMHQYTPDYEWLRNHPSDEDILYYINSKLKLFYNRTN